MRCFFLSRIPYTSMIVWKIHNKRIYFCFVRNYWVSFKFLKSPIFFKQNVPCDKKVELVNRLSETGLTRIEVTSFVSPKWIPQLADAKMVMAEIKRNPLVRYSVLTPNLKGFKDAVCLILKSTAKLNQLKFVISHFSWAFELQYKSQPYFFIQSSLILKLRKLQYLVPPPKRLAKRT